MGECERERVKELSTRYHRLMYPELQDLTPYSCHGEGRTFFLSVHPCSQGIGGITELNQVSGCKL